MYFMEATMKNQNVDKSQLVEIFRLRLKELLERKKISKGKQAEEMGIKLQTLNNYITDKKEVVCSILNLVKISSYYRVSTDYLLGFTNNKFFSNLKRVYNVPILDDEAADKLKKISQKSMHNKESREILKIINYILDSDGIIDLCKSIARLRAIKSEIDSLKEKKYKNKNNDIKQKKESMNYQEWIVHKNFEKVLSEIIKKE